MELTVTSQRLDLSAEGQALQLVSEPILLFRMLVEPAVVLPVGNVVAPPTGYTKAVNGETELLIPATEHGMSRVRGVHFWDADGWEQSVLTRRMPNGDVLVYTAGLVGTLELV